MACRWEILVPSVGRSPASYDELAPWLAESFEELDRLEAELSRFLPTSDVSRVSALSHGHSVTVGLDTLRCLAVGLELYDVTDGGFDMARGSGLERLKIDVCKRRVTVLGAPVTLDLGGLAKGYAIDRLAELVAESLCDDWGFSGFLVHGGQSSVRAVGEQPSGQPWSIALRDPSGVEVHRVALRDAVLSGSGTEVKGDHIVDPRTGDAPRGDRATWAIAADGAWSDALSTTLLLVESAAMSPIIGRAAKQAGALRSFVWEAGALSELYLPGDA